MSTTWYYKVGEREFGPVTAQQLREKAAQAEIQAETFVRQAPDGRWVRADAVRGLLPSGAPATVSPPPPAGAPPVARPAPPPLPATGMPGWLMPIAAVGLVLLGMVLALFVVRWSYQTEAQAPLPAPATQPTAAVPDPAEASIEPAASGSQRPEEPNGAEISVSPVAAGPNEPPPVSPVSPEPEVPGPPDSQQPPLVFPREPGPKEPPPGELDPGDRPSVDPTPQEPPTVDPEPMVPEGPVPGETTETMLTDDVDWAGARIERLEEIYQELVPLFDRWQKLESEAMPLRAELGPAVALCRQLEQQGRQLQREMQMLQNAYRSVQNDPEAADTAADLAVRLRYKQQQMTELSVALSRAQSQKASLEAKIRELTEYQQQLIQSADQQSREWVSLCDPLGRLDKAIHQRVADSVSGWIVKHPRIALLHLARGFAMLRLEQPDRALSDFASAAQCDPRLAALAAAARGYAFAKKGDARRSGVEFGKALKLNPKLGAIRMFRGQAYIEQGKYSQAYKELRLALRADEDVPEARDAMALLLAASPHESIRDGKKAVEHATKACELVDWRNWAYLSTLAAAYAEAGQFDEAVRWAQKAMEMAPAECRDELRKRLSLYQAGKPYRLK